MFKQYVDRCTCVEHGRLVAAVTTIEAPLQQGYEEQIIRNKYKDGKARATNEYGTVKVIGAELEATSLTEKKDQQASKERD